MARLSALTATRSVTGPSPPAPARAGSASAISPSSSRTRSTWAQSRAPAGVGRQGWPRRTSTVPTRSSSARTRCDTAEGVTPSAAAARSKLPSRTTAATAASDG